MTQDIRMIHRYNIDSMQSPSLFGRVVISQRQESEESFGIPLFSVGQMLDYSFHARLDLMHSEIITIVGEVTSIKRSIFGIDYSLLIPNGNIIEVAQTQLTAHALTNDGPKYAQQLPLL